MQYILKILFKKEYLACLFGLALVFFGLSFINRSIHTDDAWLGEQAYWFAEKGYVKSELFRGLLNYEDQQFVYHKLFIWAGALFITIFGFDLYVLKSLSLLFLLIFLILFASYGNNHLKLEKSVLYIMGTIIVLNPLIFYYSFVFRPEVMLMTLGFIAYVFLDLSNKGNNTVYAFIAGAFCGFSLLTHLNGLSLAITGFVVLILFKKFKLCFYFSSAVALVSSLYFVDLHTLSAINEYLYQFKSDPALETNDYTGGWSYLHNLLTEHKRFFRDPKTLTFSILVIILMVIGNKALKDYSFLKIFTAILIITFATLAQSKTTKYMIIYLPYLWLIVSISLQYVIRIKDAKYFTGALGIILMYLIVSVTYNVLSYKENRNIIERHADISQKYDLHNRNMVGPITFIYQQMGKQTIQSVRLFTFLKKRGDFNDGGNFDFFKAAEHFKNETIILTPASFNLLQLQLPKELGTFGNYRLIDIIDNEFYIYKLKNIRL